MVIWGGDLDGDSFSFQARSLYFMASIFPGICFPARYTHLEMHVDNEYEREDDPPRLCQPAPQAPSGANYDYFIPVDHP